jgi:hypothetical protein
MDAAVSGADAMTDRPGFLSVLQRIAQQRDPNHYRGKP